MYAVRDFIVNVLALLPLCAVALWDRAASFFGMGALTPPSPQDPARRLYAWREPARIVD